MAGGAGSASFLLAVTVYRVRPAAECEAYLLSLPAHELDALWSVLQVFRRAVAGELVGAGAGSEGMPCSRVRTALARASWVTFLRSSSISAFWFLTVFLSWATVARSRFSDSGTYPGLGADAFVFGVLQIRVPLHQPSPSS